MMMLRAPGSHRLLDHIPPPKHERERHASIGATVSHIKRSRTDGRPHGCEDFLHGHQGHAFGAPAGTARAALRAQTARHQAASPAQHPRSAAGGCGVPPPLAAAASPLPTGGRPASRRLPRAVSPHPAAGGAGRSAWRPRLQELTGRPPRASHPVTGTKITVKGARYAHVADAMALRATLDTDLPRQDPAPIRRTGKDRLKQAARASISVREAYTCLL